MGWTDWMCVTLSLPEELELEKMIRAIGRADDLQKLQELAVSLTRQNWHQTKLLKQAVARIAEQDLMLDDK